MMSLANDTLMVSVGGGGGGRKTVLQELWWYIRKSIGDKLGLCDR